jgi:hypothetical protein
MLQIAMKKGSNSIKNWYITSQSLTEHVKSHVILLLLQQEQIYKYRMIPGRAAQIDSNDAQLPKTK